MASSQLEPYLPDFEVHAVQEVLYSRLPKMIGWNTQFVTTRIEPPWHGILPDGTTGWTEWAVVQFVIQSDHPRPIQRGRGMKHVTLATAWQNVFEDSLKDSHFVHGSKGDPLLTIFEAVLAKHVVEMDSLGSIQRDATSDPDDGKIKSALDAL